MIYKFIYEKVKKYVKTKNRIKKLKSINVDILSKYNILEIDKINFGQYSYIGPNSYINAIGGLEIGNNVIIGPSVKIWTENHNWKSKEMVPYDQIDYYQKVVIGNNVWVGLDVKICPGTTIGEGAIIGMGSVVRGSIPPLAIVIGNPGKVIGYRDSDDYNQIILNEGFYYKIKKSNKLLKESIAK